MLGGCFLCLGLLMHDAPISKYSYGLLCHMLTKKSSHNLLSFYLLNCLHLISERFNINNEKEQIHILEESKILGSCSAFAIFWREITELYLISIDYFSFFLSKYLSFCFIRFLIFFGISLQRVFSFFAFNCHIAFAIVFSTYSSSESKSESWA